MSLEYIKKHYKVPAEIGRRIKFKGNREGVIVGSHNAGLSVVFDGRKRNQSDILHPTWEVEYLGMGKTPKMTRSQERYQRYIDSEYGGTFAEFLGIKPKEEVRKSYYY